MISSREAALRPLQCLLSPFGPHCFIHHLRSQRGVWATHSQQQKQQHSSNNNINKERERRPADYLDGGPLASGDAPAVAQEQRAEEEEEAASRRLCGGDKADGGRPLAGDLRRRQGRAHPTKWTTN